MSRYNYFSSSLLAVIVCLLHGQLSAQHYVNAFREPVTPYSTITNLVLSEILQTEDTPGHFDGTLIGGWAYTNGLPLTRRGLTVFKLDELGDTMFCRTINRIVGSTIEDNPGAQYFLNGMVRSYDGSGNPDGYVFAFYAPDITSDNFVIKTNLAVNSIVWAKAIGGAVKVQALCRTSTGQYALALEMLDGSTRKIGVGILDASGVAVNWPSLSTWIKRYGDTATSGGPLYRPNTIEQTSDGGFVVAGRYSSTAFPPGTSGRSFILRTEADGDLVFLNKYTVKTTSGSEDVFNIIQTDDDNDSFPDDGFLLANTVLDSLQKFHYLKVDVNGDVDWAKRYYHTHGNGNGVAGGGVHRIQHPILWPGDHRYISGMTSVVGMVNHYTVLVTDMNGVPDNHTCLHYQAGNTGDYVVNSIINDDYSASLITERGRAIRTNSFYFLPDCFTTTHHINYDTMAVEVVAATHVSNVNLSVAAVDFVIRDLPLLQNPACSSVCEDLAIDSIATVNSTCGVCNGAATAFVSGGATPYQYYWQNGDSSSEADSLCGGECYTLMVTDSSGIEGCTVYASVCIEATPEHIDYLSLNTGIDPATGAQNDPTTLPFGANEENWTVLTPDSLVIVNLYNPCDSSKVLDLNQADSTVLQYCFCTYDSSLVTIKMDIRSVHAFVQSVMLDGNLIDSDECTLPGSGNFLQIDHEESLPAGHYCITITLIRCGDGQSAVDICGSVEGNLLAAACCEEEEAGDMENRMLSQNQPSTHTLQAYPNPTNSLVRLTGDFNPLRPASIYVYDMLGHRVMAKQLMTVNGCEIDISKLSAGLYSVIISQDSIQYSTLVRKD